jgi:hypothetical protein
MPIKGGTQGGFKEQNLMIQVVNLHVFQNPPSFPPFSTSLNCQSKTLKKGDEPDMKY